MGRESHKWVIQLVVGYKLPISVDMKVTHTNFLREKKYSSAGKFSDIMSGFLGYEILRFPKVINNFL